MGLQSGAEGRFIPLRESRKQRAVRIHPITVVLRWSASSEEVACPDHGLDHRVEQSGVNLAEGAIGRRIGYQAVEVPR